MATGEWRKIHTPFETRFNQNIQILRSRARAAALNLPGAAAEVQNAKSQVVMTLIDYSQKARELDTTLNTMLASQASSVDAVRNTKAEVETLKHTVADARTLHDIRKEQVETLKSKTAANYHTSYLGLWVPLHENTRVFLFAVSVFFFLLAMSAIGCMIWSNKFPEKLVALAHGGVYSAVRRK